MPARTNFRAPLIEFDDDHAQFAIEIVYDGTGAPIQLNGVACNLGELTCIEAVAIGPFDDGVELFQSMLRRLRDLPRQLTFDDLLT